MIRLLCVGRRTRTKTLLNGQVRRVHVLHQMFDKFPYHEHLANISRKQLPPAKDFSLLDVNEKEVRIVTLSQALNIIRGSETPAYLAQVKPDLYQIKPIGKVTKTKGQLSFKRSGRSKDLPLTTTVDPQRLQYIMDKAYDFLLQGCRLEMILRQGTKNRMKSYTVDWALENAPHLRPDTILAAMPNNSKMLVQPCNAFKMGKSPQIQSTVTWAIEHPPSLKRFGLVTPEKLYRMGEWTSQYEPVKGRSKKSAPGRRSDFHVSDVSNIHLESLIEPNIGEDV